MKTGAGNQGEDPLEALFTSFANALPARMQGRAAKLRTPIEYNGRATPADTERGSSGTLPSCLLAMCLRKNRTQVTLTNLRSSGLEPV
jgi:hypothetical protein